MNAGAKYDLILMDIIMPNLDGVSATHLIRQFDSTPIVAMTSNIRSDDISMYFSHGMNDVLPKPFTKEGLLSMLEKHLGHLKKQSLSMDHLAPQAPQVVSAKRSFKSEDSPATSPAALSSWNSPGNMAGVSPAGSNANDDPYMAAVHNSAPPPGYGMQPGMQHGQAPMYQTSPTGQMNAPPRQGAMGAPNHRRGISDISGGADMGGEAKRPMYGQGQPQLGPQMHQVQHPMQQRPPR